MMMRCRVLAVLFPLSVFGLSFGREGSTAGSVGSAVFELGLAKHVFIDDVMIESKKGVTFTMNAPRMKEKVLWQTEAWEAGDIGFCHSVVKEGDRFRMWYGPALVEKYDDNKPAGWVCLAAYAESKDGIHWTKPALGMFEYRGSKENNICFRGIAGWIHPGTVFVDPNARSPAEKYKMVYGDFYRVRLPGRPSHTTVNGAISPDGLHWRPVDTPHAVIMRDWGTDTQSVAFFDPNIDRYVAYVRCNVDRPETREIQAYRRAGRSERVDFLSFPPPTICLAPDEKDAGGKWGSGIYNTAAHVCAQAPWTYYFFPSVLNRKTGVVTIQLGLSRDGVHIRRPFRKPYVPRQAGAESQYMGIGMVPVGDELWMYHTAYPGWHTVVGRPDPHEADNNLRGVKYRTIQRLDGFVSFDAGPVGGTIVTKPFVCRGQRLEINADAKGGSLTVDILDRAGSALATSEPLQEDNVRARPRWMRIKGLGALIGRPIRLRFTMRSCKLFAFQMCGGKEGEAVSKVRLPTSTTNTAAGPSPASATTRAATAAP